MTKEFNSLDDILDFAINEEKMAAEFYTALAAKIPFLNGPEIVPLVSA